MLLNLHKQTNKHSQTSKFNTKHKTQTINKNQNDKNSPRPGRKTAVFVFVLAIIPFFSPNLHRLLTLLIPPNPNPRHRRRPPRVPPPVLDPNQHHMHPTLQRVAADPEPNRRVRLLVYSQQQHDHRDHHERHVPHDVQSHHGLRVPPVGPALLQLPRRRLPYQHGRAPPPRGSAKKQGQSGGASCCCVGAALAGAEEWSLWLRRGGGGGGGGGGGLRWHG